jgi:hypothetical protein
VDSFVTGPPLRKGATVAEPRVDHKIQSNGHVAEKSKFVTVARILVGDCCTPRFGGDARLSDRDRVTLSPDFDPSVTRRVGSRLALWSDHSIHVETQRTWINCSGIYSTLYFSTRPLS